MGECDAAQAAALVRALCDVIDEMTRHLAWLEHRGCRPEADALRRDINEAQGHINQLQRKYLAGRQLAPARRLVQPAR
jgi:hypothetical protein